MAIIDKIKESIELQGLEFYYQSEGDINLSLDQATFPAAYMYLINQGTIFEQSAQTVEQVDVGMFFVKTTEFDFDSIENEAIIDECKIIAINWLRYLRLTSNLEIVSVGASQRVYDNFDVIVTGYAVTVTIKETYGVSACGNEIPDPSCDCLSCLDDTAEWLSKSYSSVKIGELLGLKQDVLFAGDNITIEGNVISSTGGGDSTAVLASIGAPLYATTIDSDVSTYRVMQNLPQETSVQVDTILTGTEHLIRNYLYNEQIGATFIDAGNWGVSVRYKLNRTQGVTKFRIVPFLHHLNGTETELFEFESPELNSTIITDKFFESPQGAYSCLETDRLGFRIYGITTSSPDVTLSVMVGDGNPTYFIAPLALRHINLRDPNGDPNVQHLTAAQIAAIPLKPLIFENVPVLFEDWTNSPSGTYIYQQIIPLSGVTEDDFADVVFSDSDSDSGNYSSTVITNNGNVIIYSKTNNTTVIPTILIHRL